MLATKEHRLPQGEELSLVGDVVVRASVRQLRIKGIELIEVRTGTGVHGPRPGELRVDHEFVGELMLQLGQHCIVVACAAIAEELYAVHLWIEWNALHRRYCVAIIVETDVPRLAPLVPKREDKVR